MPLSDVIADYETGVYTVTRSTPNAVVDGIPTPSTTATFAIDASVQPVDGDTLKDLPEGQRAEETRVIWTTTELMVRTPSTEPDTLVIDGVNYRVTKVSHFNILDNFFRCYAEKTDVL